MIMKALFISLIATSLTLAAAWSAEPPQPVQAVPASPPRPRWLEAYDANKNGLLEPQELAAAKAALAVKRQEFKQRYDADGDGKLNREEVVTMRRSLSQSRTNSTPR